MNIERAPTRLSGIRETHTVEEAACRLGIGRSLAYRLVREGEIPAIRLGTRLLVPRTALEALLGSYRRGGVDQPPSGEH